jgi:hypothetical protein
MTKGVISKLLSLVGISTQTETVSARAMYDNELIGVWKSDAEDVDGLSSFGQATLEFTANGALKYTVHESGKDAVILLTFRVEPGFLVTNQPSHPREERTAYQVRQDGKLSLSLGGQQALYSRVV